MRKRTIISVLCLSLSIPAGALAETGIAQTPQLVKVEGSNLKASVDSTSITGLAGDISGPVLESATATPTTVTVGETITITVTASDDLSEVASIDAYLNLPDSKGYKTVPLEFDTGTKEWKGTYTITELDLNGTWIVDFVLYDTAGNYSYGEPIDPIQVVNPNGGDGVAPTLETSSVSPLSVGVNEEVTIRAKVNDTNGVGSVFAAVYTADSTGYYYLPLTYDEATGEWVGSHYFTESDRSGSWYIDIDMFDKAGNFDYVMLKEELVLRNPFGDFTSPSIGNVAITPLSASPGESVHLSVPVSDDKSGVSSVYAEFSHIDAPYVTYLRHMTRDPNSGEWVVDFDIESGFQSGVWNVVIHSTDNAGNSGFKEISGAFDVINNDGDFDAPVISNVQVTQGEVQIGDTVTVTAKVSDNDAVDSVYASLYSQEGAEFISMTYDAENDQWVGSFVVEETTVPGFYTATVSAYDASFNFNWGDAAGGFTVVNTTGDYTGPVISAVTLDKTEVNAGEQVTITATVEDVESGVASVKANYYENQSVELTYDSTLDKWVGTITVPTNVPEGTVIKINFIDALDKKGNLSLPFFDVGSFLVHNPDGTAPAVESLVLTPTAAKQGETVHFEAKLVDNLSGVKSATIYLYHEIDSSVTTINLTNDGATDVWTADYVIPVDAGLGTYSVSLGVEDNAGNMANATGAEKLNILESPVISKQYDIALWYFQNDNLYNAVYYAGAAIKEGDKRPEVQELMDNVAQALLDAAARMSEEKAGDAYQLLVATTGVPTAIKEAAQAKLIPVVKSPYYLEADWYYDNGNYYNAVYFAGAAIAEGDTRAKVQTLLNDAAQSLLEEAPGKSSWDAQNDYNLLISTAGVPTAIKEAATKKLSAELKYAEAAWYNENGNKYNAVHLASAAIALGNTRPEVQALLNSAAQALLDAAPGKNSWDAQNDYNLLISTTGVPTAIKEAATKKLSAEVNFGEAVWYNENGNKYNAVYYAGAAIAEGNTRPEVQNFMNSAAQALFDAAATMNSTDALNAYALLANTTGVPAAIKAAAQAKL